MKPDKSFKIQSVKIISLLANVVLLGVYAYNFWQPPASEPSKIDRLSQMQAKTLGYQIAQLYLNDKIDRFHRPPNSETHSASREPSSLAPVEGTPEQRLVLSQGRMGKDPWGEPYHYQIESSLAGGSTVVVWSEHSPHAVSIPVGPMASR